MKSMESTEIIIKKIVNGYLISYGLNGIDFQHFDKTKKEVIDDVEDILENYL